MGFDPLGRLAAHAAAPYPEEPKTEAHLAAEWTRFYRGEAVRLRLGDLEREVVASAAAVGACEAELKTAKARDGRMGRLPAPWEREQERRAAAIDVANLTHRLIRLAARRDVLRNVLDQRVALVMTGKLTD